MAHASYLVNARHGAWWPATGLVLRRPVAGFYSAVNIHRKITRNRPVGLQAGTAGEKVR